MIDNVTEKKVNGENNTEKAHAYTPGLKVKRATMVKKMRRLPLLGEVYPKVGDVVNYDDIVDCQKFMTKQIGDVVEKGETIAFYSALWGLIKKDIKTPVMGTLESYSDVTGQLILRGAPIPVEIDAYIPGKVIEVMPREGAIIETNAAFIQGIFGIGGEIHGDIHVEEVGITLIITEGFGRMNMSLRTFKLLKEFDGFRASVNGTTQIRAGVMRPEIIIPHDIAEEDEGESVSQGMVSGTPIRIIRQPYFGAIGVVHSLPVELQRLESESAVRVIRIELDGGEVVTVPRANVEIIEE
jgi:hypothetical protein